jgi:allophanate hydrolase subunit 2
VPNGGPFDGFLFEIAQKLAGEAAEVWEVAPGQTTFVAEADGQIAILRPESGEATQGSRLFPARAGDRVPLAVGWGMAAVGARAYVSYGGGAADRDMRLALPVRSEGPLRAVAFSGPMEMHQRRVLPQSDRRGIRLSSDGNPAPADGRPSQPTFFGHIQHTPDGGAIILGPDGPTIGGYPSPGWIIRADLDRVAQLLPGDQVSIEWVSREFSIQLWQARQDLLDRFLRELRVTLELW